jgi:hypothetical protein
MVSLSHADRCLRPALQQCEAGKADEPRDVFSGHRTCFAFHEARQNVYKDVKGIDNYFWGCVQLNLFSNIFK